ncbi:hypothetical protein [Streptomyces sp. NPDC051921]|uniref:hypothetical protein n=1 Tax=Streptomyces sp. NPDC051921 TaxID=3155806 RepID=UPI0034324D16
MGPRAARSVSRLRRDLPGASPEELRTTVVARGVRRVSAEGSFVGGPFLVLVPFAFCGALLSQARIALELAALEGRDPTDPERAAELLVLQGVYANTDAARTALATRGTEEHERPGRTAALWELIMRMARLLGLITPSAGTSGLLVRTGQWALVGAVFLVGLVAPLVWLPYLAFSYHRSTLTFTDRAAVFYAGAAPPPRASRIDPGTVSALLRALVSLLVPVGALLVVALTDTQLAGSRWPLLVLLLFTASVTVGGWWVWRRAGRKAGDDEERRSG